MQMMAIRDKRQKFSLPNFILLYKFWNNLPDLDSQFNYI